ncbi:siphovirus Gp157 family protein [Acidocella aminolytica]|uniref:Siphovirus Gp157 n=1 Tax=Acidocella aminolytica 101 = DSM 11237 TaxID=1120923 RepID=A0A0D6PDI0_9PROT|nr:siphovirus Gp157 family protein [Acidocella aminolytica]GAN79815.1 hypothetical protein Aam_030_048 [Acidocella aminolytica 101 = DSM 11237]GBQ34338.1 hypothetical protein AA11237_0720 [Acidocella aminolytica 101 = DSM 11237]SHF36358.1 virus Gp157 [Acidocella aminolytica 101 = DSM 11237]
MKKTEATPAYSRLQLSEAMATLHRLRSDLLEMDPTIAEDEALLFDMLDGEGGEAMEMLRTAMRASLEAKSIADGIEHRQDTLASRRMKMLARADKIKGAVVATMQALGLKKLPDVEFTLTITPGRRSAKITDPTLLPEKFIKTETTRTPKKKDIAEALKAGEVVPGATLSNGEPVATVRH